MSISEGSVSLDQDNEFIVKKIQQCNDVDEQVAEFFELLQPTNENIEYYQEIDVRSDMVVFTKATPYPETVLTAAVAATHRVYFGTFHQFHHYYCIIDNALYVWPYDSDKVTILTEEADLITAVACGNRNSLAYHKKVKQIIVIGTNNKIKILAYTEKEICNYDTVERNISFIASAIAVGDDGTIYIGSEDGDIYGLTYSIKKTQRKKPYQTKLVNLTANIFKKYAPKVLRFIHPIISIVIDNSTGYMAALDSKSKIWFYKIVDNKLKEVYNVDFKTQANIKIISVTAVPISDSSYTRFIGFDQRGNRYFFGPNPGSFDANDEIIFLKQIRPAHSGFNDQELIEADYSLGYTFFMFRKMIAITRPKQTTHIAEINPPEQIAFYHLEQSDALRFTHESHLLSETPLKLFNNEMLWQHLVPPPPGHLLTSSGIINVTYSLPVDQFGRLLMEYHGNFSDPVRMWMSNNADEAESSATALLFASKSVEPQRQQALFLIYQFSRLLSQSTFQASGKMTTPCSAFILRTSRLLAPIWYNSIFIKKHNKVQLHDLYRELPGNYIDQLRRLIELSNEYIRIRRASTEQGKPEEQKETVEESHMLHRLCSYLRSLIDTIKFIQIMGEQKKTVLTEAMNLLSESSQNRLFDKFGDDKFSLNRSNSLIEALRDFASALFNCENGPKRDDVLARRLGRECPAFFCEADSNLIDAMEQLRNAANQNESARIPTLQRVLNVFLKYSMQPLKLSEICSLFKSMNYYTGIISIVLKRAHSIDPMQKALQWYKGGRRDDDELGRMAFDKRYFCYQHLFEHIDNPNAFQLMTNSDDELFHICLYDYLTRKNKSDMLMSSRTPYLMSYLKETHQELLWEYHAKHKDYGTAAAQLLELTRNDPNATLATRIKWLTNVTNYAKGSGMSAAHREAQTLLKCAEIQQELVLKTHHPEDKLVPQQALFDKCCTYGYWDLVLKLLSFTPITGQNQKHVISQAWLNMMVEQLFMDDLTTIRTKLVSLTFTIDPLNDVLDPSIVMPILEDFRMNKLGTVLWAVETMLQCKFIPNKLLETYVNALENENLIDDAKCAFTYCAMYLIQQGAITAGHNLNTIKEWFIQNGRNQPYYEDVFSLLNRLP